MSRKNLVSVIASILLLLVALLSACGDPTTTPVPPTATPLPPTATPVPPTATPLPPTATPVPPTATPLPPTATPLPPTPTRNPADGPTYSEVVKTYPLNTQLCKVEVDVQDDTTQPDKIIVNFKAGTLIGSPFCYGTKITAIGRVTINGKQYEAGSMLTADKNGQIIKVSSWD
ncbi:MAG: hypothetical protein HXX08_09430 [Chloroflexi bacterium]|uniref:DUF5666 domain-containing protein n=1 Tax=Candidatus Chlorohelix allophototropha TaxID=3003348 RepID=A0A8T7M366_9CHLR|nr:hypothetical protein [Chloroflexota bacterium]WJW67945.1 hypothetical protein OZ401_001230 [Chloroflexota bacterium L227-S17]